VQVQPGQYPQQRHNPTTPGAPFVMSAPPTSMSLRQPLMGTVAN